MLVSIRQATFCSLYATVVDTSYKMWTFGFIVCTLYSSERSASFSLCRERNCSDVINNDIRQITNEIQNGRPLYLKTHSKHLCQPMDRVYSCLESADGIVSSCHLPVKRPKIHSLCVDCRLFAGSTQDREKLCLGYFELSIENS
jgi:hypothetical protein